MIRTVAPLLAVIIACSIMMIRAMILGSDRVGIKAHEYLPLLLPCLILMVFIMIILGGKI